MNCDVIVSGGLGCSIMPFRLGVPPEIVLVTLGGAGPVIAYLRRRLRVKRILRKTIAFKAIEGRK